MTPQKKSGEQSHAGGGSDNSRVGQSQAGESGHGSASAPARGPKAGEPRVHSQIFVDYVANEIPIYPIEEFLEHSQESSDQQPNDQVARFLKRAGAFRIELKTGESAYPEPTELRPLIVVEKGAVSLSVRRGEFVSRPRRVGPGCVFGEAPILRVRAFGAEAAAAEPTTIFLLDSSRVEELIWSSPALARRWMKKISRLAERSALETRMLLFGLVESRIAVLLSESADEDSVISNLTHSDLARKLGVHRETLSIALRSMRRQRLVKVKRRKVEILSHSGLARLIQPFLEEQTAAQAESEGGNDD